MNDLKEVVLDNPNMVGEILKAYRREKKITQEELASFAGLSRIGVVKLEKNEGDIKLSTLIKVVGLLGFDLVLKSRENK
ncbi:MAG: helix-turn-helix transcriptional regulator [Bacteriovoracaceae bacterium]|nr:helix-turn-helix transcriptional regulator [Bacteriovoracaceae bacterium]